MKTFNILISEKIAGTLRVRAKDAQEAREKAQKAIDANYQDAANNELPIDIAQLMQESDGFVIKDVQESEEGEGVDIE